MPYFKAFSQQINPRKKVKYLQKRLDFTRICGIIYHVVSTQRPRVPKTDKNNYKIKKRGKSYEAHPPSGQSGRQDDRS
jgi:hypothetical protein